MSANTPYEAAPRQIDLPHPLESTNSAVVTDNPDKIWTFKKLSRFPFTQPERSRRFFVLGLIYTILALTGLVHAYGIPYLWQTSQRLAQGEETPPGLSLDTFEFRALLDGCATIVLTLVAIGLPSVTIAWLLGVTTPLAGPREAPYSFLKLSGSLFVFVLPGVFTHCANTQDPLAACTRTPYRRIFSLPYLKTHLLLNATFGVLLVPGLIAIHIPLIGSLIAPLVAPMVFWLLVIWVAAYSATMSAGSSPPLRK